MKGLKNIIEKYIDFLMVSLVIVEVVVCPIVFLFMAGNLIQFLVVYISSFGLWYPLIKIAERKFKGNVSER